jgi:hypothetical protein
VIYQVYPRSFADANGDGIGDIDGIRAHLGHLHDLGIDAIWMSPWYPSPMADAGYDVADFRDIDPVFGTLAEAKAFIEEANRLGLRVIIDVVPNHCSSAHAWFVEALRAGPDPRSGDGSGSAQGAGRTAPSRRPTCARSSAGRRVPGRGAGPLGGRGHPVRDAPGPDVAPLRPRRPGPRRLSGAAALVGQRAAVRLQPAVFLVTAPRRAAAVAGRATRRARVRPGRRDSSAWSTSPAARFRCRHTTPFCSPAADSTAARCLRKPPPG